MEIDTVSLDRRKQPRIIVRDSAIAVIQSTPTILLGQIKDMGMGGLSFTYMHSDKQPNESTRFDIFIPEEKLHIKGLKFRTISDSIIMNDNPFSTIVMNRRGIEFIDITDHQRSQLAHVMQILSHTDLQSGCPIFNIKHLAGMSV